MWNMSIGNTAQHNILASIVTRAYSVLVKYFKGSGGSWCMGTDGKLIQLEYNPAHILALSIQHIFLYYRIGQGGHCSPPNFHQMPPWTSKRAPCVFFSRWVETSRWKSSIGVTTHLLFKPLAGNQRTLVSRSTPPLSKNRYCCDGIASSWHLWIDWQKRISMGAIA